MSKKHRDKQGRLVRILTTEEVAKIDQKGIKTADHQPLPAPGWGFQRMDRIGDKNVEPL